MRLVVHQHDTCHLPRAVRGCAGGAPNLHPPAMEVGGGAPNLHSWRVEVGGGAREVRREYAVSSAIGRCFRVGRREACNLFTLALAGTHTCPGGNAHLPWRERKCQGVPGSARVLLH
jgi:hypothetical protein